MTTNCCHFWLFLMSVKKGFAWNPLWSMAPRAGLEPATNGLTAQAKTSLKSLKTLYYNIYIVMLIV